MTRLNRPRLFAVALLTLTTSTLNSQDPLADGEKTLSGTVVEVQKEFNRLVFRSTDGDRLRTYSLPLADEVRVRVNDRDGRVSDLKPGTAVQVRTAGANGGKVVAVRATRNGPPKADAGPDLKATTAATNLSLAYPTGDRATSLLLIETTGPEKVRVGESYAYEIRLTNLTKNMALDDVRVIQQQTAQMAIESSEPGRDAEGETRWTIRRLMPGATEVIKVRAVGEEEGLAASCIRVKYEPTVCMVTQFVKPDVQLTKLAPAEAHICDPIPVRYTVRNSGSADARKLVVRDDLPDGLTTEDGKKVVAFEVGDLAAGQSREVTAKLVAAQGGTYASRAVAETADGGKAQSKKTETTVRTPKLAVAVDGPDTAYVNQPATYTVRVVNGGDAPARQARLQLALDGKVRLDKAGRAGEGGPEPTAAADKPVVWDLGVLKPNEERVARVTVTGTHRGELTQVATVTTACARDLDDARAEAVARTEMLTLPALRLSLVDAADPIRVGDEVTYTLTIDNQGTGPDTNVQTVIELPPGLEFKEAAGTTEGKADGQRVTFGKLATLPAGEKAVWTLRATARRQADVRTRAELSSDYLRDPASSVEPTRLIDSK